MSGLDGWIMDFLDSPTRVVVSAGMLLALIVAALYADQVLFYFRLIVKSLRRNVLRSLLTSLATVVLVLVVTRSWSLFKVPVTCG